MSPARRRGRRLGRARPGPGRAALPDRADAFAPGRRPGTRRGAPAGPKVTRTCVKLRHRGDSDRCDEGDAGRGGGVTVHRGDSDRHHEGDSDDHKQGYLDHYHEGDSDHITKVTRTVVMRVTWTI